MIDLQRVHRDHIPVCRITGGGTRSVVVRLRCIAIRRPLLGAGRQARTVCGTCIARHPRGHEPHALIRNPAHFDGLFRPKANASTPIPSNPAVDPMCRPLSVYTELVEGGRQ